MTKQRIVLMLDPDVVDRVRGLAERDRRSVSAQAQVMLERAIALDDAGYIGVPAPNAPGPGPAQRP